MFTESTASPTRAEFGPFNLFSVVMSTCQCSQQLGTFLLIFFLAVFTNDWKKDLKKKTNNKTHNNESQLTPMKKYVINYFNSNIQHLILWYSVQYFIYLFKKNCNQHWQLKKKEDNCSYSLNRLQEYGQGYKKIKSTVKTYICHMLSAISIELCNFQVSQKHGQRK